MGRTPTRCRRGCRGCGGGCRTGSSSSPGAGTGSWWTRTTWTCTGSSGRLGKGGGCSGLGRRMVQRTCCGKRWGRGGGRRWWICWMLRRNWRRRARSRRGSRRPPGRAGSARPGSRSRRPGGGRGTCASSTCRRWSTGRRCRTWCSEAVAAVCGSDDALADLVDRSLLRVRAGRYRMLDTILLYCKEKLVESGEELEQAHARHFLDLVHRADPHLRRAEQLDRLALLSAEHDNLVAALRWAARHDQPTAMRLVTAAAAHGGLPGWRVAAPRAGGAVVAGGQPLPGHDQPGVGAVVLEGARGAAGGFRVREHVGRVRQRAGGGRRVRAGG